MTGIQVIIHPQIKLCDLTRRVLLGGMVENRDENREPVIRAFVALPVETLVEVTERCLPGSGLCVSATSGLITHKSRRTIYVHNHFKQRPKSREG